MSKKIKIVHVHTDTKFIHNVDNFENDEFENILIFIGSIGSYSGPYKDSIQYYKTSPRTYKNIISLCSTSHIVILYNLNFSKAYIANRLPKTVVVIWRFFGTELYLRIPEQVYSPETLDILKIGKREDLHKKIKQHLGRLSYVVKYQVFSRKEIDKAIFSRVDLFLGLVNMEYEFLKNIWPHLPPFMQFNIPPFRETTIDKKVRFNRIIIGNNRSSYNNHINIIQRLKETQYSESYNFIFIFNYGSQSSYTKYIKNEAQKIKGIQVLENFLSQAEFHELYANADAFVINCYRQMALGNILEALRKNIKIYLDEKNLIYHWLKNNGLLIFTINDFFLDLETNTISLSLADATFNQERLKELSSIYSKEAFQRTIIETIKKKVI